MDLLKSTCAMVVMIGEDAHAVLRHDDAVFVALQPMPELPRGRIDVYAFATLQENYWFVGIRNMPHLHSLIRWRALGDPTAFEPQEGLALALARRIVGFERLLRVIVHFHAVSRASFGADWAGPMQEAPELERMVRATANSSIVLPLSDLAPDVGAEA